MEDMSVVEKFLEEVGLEEGQKDEIVSVIKGMGELLNCLHLCICTSCFFSGTTHMGHNLVQKAQSSSLIIMHVCILL